MTPEKAAEITWLKADDIRRAARLFAEDTPGCIQVGSSLERQANCGQTLRAIICLMGISGNIERPGQYDELGACRPPVRARTSTLKSPSPMKCVKNIIGGG